MSVDSDAIRVLHVDDEPDFASMVATFLEREDDRFVVETATGASEGLAQLVETDVDCVVSDYEMPGRNGIEFLDAVRETLPDTPFILYTGRGSEEIASEAISAGVTDYLQKRAGNEQYTVLANRITNAVEGERAQRQRRRQLDAIEAAQEGISILDDGRFIYVNEAYADLYGYDPDELIGEPWELLYRDADVPDIYEDVLPAVRDTGYWHGTTTGLRSDGTTFLEDHVLASIDRDELVCTVRDVTDHEERRDRLKEAVSKFEALFENSPDMVSTHDVDGRLIDVNRRFSEALDYSKDELTSMSVWDVDTTVDPANARAFWGELSPDDVRLFEGRYRRRDGTTFPVEVHLVRLDEEAGGLFLSISHDITERKRRQQVVETLHEAATTIQTATSVVDACERTIDAATDVLEFDICTVLIREDEWLVPYATSKRAPTGGSRRLRIDQGIGGKTFRTGESQLVTEISADDEADPTKGAYRSGISVPVGEWGVFQAVGTDPNAFDEDDIEFAEILVSHAASAIERIEHEVDLTRQNERLEELASIVSHDLRNPLNVAEGRLELARTECENEHLDDVARAHERMTVLIDDLLTVAREGAAVGSFETVDIASITEKCWNTVETGDASVEVDVDRPIRADESRLRQVFENLFRNSVEHGDEGVALHIGELDDGFFVTDDGPGIPETARDDVFEAGYSTRDGGTGFGLRIVEEIIDAHGWEIRVTEGSAGGARFEITGVGFAE